ncbi:hypothetical protein NPIL_690771 [Nephila pilipes]|uniref:Uncharacterized protein n=1 Tax=Nephila pilipes TaxID=299642 RepID=A0A8X6P601_NEPPI|nr:hypothetical protein NPIL_690771 [Nephila pilipes]
MSRSLKERLCIEQRCIVHNANVFTWLTVTYGSKQILFINAKGDISSGIGIKHLTSTFASYSSRILSGITLQDHCTTRASAEGILYFDTFLKFYRNHRFYIKEIQEDTSLCV